MQSSGVGKESLQRFGQAVSLMLVQNIGREVRRRGRRHDYDVVTQQGSHVVGVRHAGARPPCHSRQVADQDACVADDRGRQRTSSADTALDEGLR